MRRSKGAATLSGANGDTAEQKSEGGQGSTWLCETRACLKEGTAQLPEQLYACHFQRIKMGSGLAFYFGWMRERGAKSLL